MTQDLTKLADPVPRTTGGTVNHRAEPTPPEWWARPWILPLVLVVLVFFGYQLHRFWGRWEESKAPLPPHFGFSAYYPLLLTHMACGAIAMLTAILQVWPAVRRNNPVLHRYSGRLYVLASLGGGTAGLLILKFAPPIGRIGIGLATVVWMASSVIGWALARAKYYALHRVYMLVSFVTLLSVIWGVVFVEIGLRITDKIDLVYIGYLIEASRWLGWVINLLILQWWLVRTASKPLDLPQPASVRRI
jgi:hypothetical protein